MSKHSSLFNGVVVMDEGFSLSPRDEKARSSPIRPSPMKPQDAKLEGVAANDRRDVVESDRAAGRLESLQRSEGEKRTGMNGFMMIMQVPW